MKITFLADMPEESLKIAQWYFDEWGYTVPGITVEMVHEKVLDKSRSRTDIPLIFIIHEDKELVGVTELKLRENKHFPEYEHWVGGVYVSPNYRGQGYASALISKAKTHTSDLGIKSLYLQCEDHNIDLYLKHDFKVLHNSEHNSVKTTIMVHDKSA
ncbi:MAG: GNAT family N-acetyltransferase [Sphingobacteriales bacterium]|nr:MAG: GNAT family N-acetyltransferase [Sphingobacteriales bacterium]